MCRQRVAAGRSIAAPRAATVCHRPVASVRRMSIFKSTPPPDAAGLQGRLPPSWSTPRVGASILGGTRHRAARTACVAGRPARPVLAGRRRAGYGYRWCHHRRPPRTGYDCTSDEHPARASTSLWVTQHAPGPGEDDVDAEIGGRLGVQLGRSSGADALSSSSHRGAADRGHPSSRMKCRPTKLETCRRARRGSSFETLLDEFPCVTTRSPRS